jgi:hypothetical protein
MVRDDNLPDLTIEGILDSGAEVTKPHCFPHPSEFETPPP